jgi:hypothetical protein
MGYPVTYAISPYQISGQVVEWDITALSTTRGRCEIPSGAKVIQIRVTGTDIGGLRTYISRGPTGSAMPTATIPDAALAEASVSGAAGGVLAAGTRGFITQGTVWRQAFEDSQLLAICLDMRTDVAGAAARRIHVLALL